MNAQAASLAVEDGPAEAPIAAVPATPILVVNDRESQRIAIRAMLAPLGLDVVEADSGRAALRAVLRQTFAAILMDVRMPTIDGYETAKLIRQRTQSGHTPIIFVTSYGSDELETTAAYANGAVDFIFTPILPEVLRAKISAFVDLYTQSQELKRSLESIKGLNQALRNSEARALAVLQNVADGIVTMDEDGLIESLNRSAQRLFGYSEEEAVGQPLEFIITHRRHDDFADPVPIDPAPDEGSTEPTQTEGRRKNGSRFPVEMEVSEMKIGERRLTIGCIRDVSGRRERAERERRRGQALRREAQRDRAAFEESPIGNIMTNRDGRIERVNTAVCTMMGRTADEMIGMQFLALTHPEDRDGDATLVASLIRGTSDTDRFETRCQHQDGSILETRVAVTAIRNDAKAVTQLFAQVEDVTEARQTGRELEQAQFEVLARLAAAAEFRDDDTGQHTRRVGDVSVAIATGLDLPDSEVELIRLAAPLHDIGKIAIPDAILGKRGRLTSAEFDRMKTHTAVGAEMLTGGAFALLEVAEQIALTHHERWDGNGYPSGLAGEAIPMVGRIVAVADVFDALTHERPYKAAWSKADATEEMSGEAGRHFDPRVLDAFLASSCYSAYLSARAISASNQRSGTRLAIAQRSFASRPSR